MLTSHRARGDPKQLSRVGMRDLGEKLRHFFSRLWRLLRSRKVLELEPDDYGIENRVLENFVIHAAVVQVEFVRLNHHPIGVMRKVERRMPVQVSSSSSDHNSKLRDSFKDTSGIALKMTKKSTADFIIRTSFRSLNKISWDSPIIFSRTPSSTNNIYQLISRF
ncbi:hypothetical protein AVEN_156583-1 [Araneus ventricosus]|uniref:Uncharacterized protein n=1 Tax=Araneus ventricosus TaxID=182803 RepID=A0A4Y2EX56_ARAVE|nr:hypothetical protein AVEN_156583-1 [Araneus ventricosus]